MQASFHILHEIQLILKWDGWSQCCTTEFIVKFHKQFALIFDYLQLPSCGALQAVVARGQLCPPPVPRPPWTTVPLAVTEWEQFSFSLVSLNMHWLVKHPAVWEQGCYGVVFTCQIGFMLSKVSSSSGQAGKATMRVSIELIPSSLSAVALEKEQE